MKILKAPLPKPTKEQVEAYYREWLARTYPNGTRETCVCKRVAQ